MTFGPVFFCCDKGYAVPLATALRSLVESNTSDWPLDVRILVDDDQASWLRKVEKSLPQGSANIRWHKIDMESFSLFSTKRHISASTFGRLLIERFVSENDERVLYLDADILVLGSLAPLWVTDLGACALGAVRDALDKEIKENTQPLQKAGLPRVANYFNAGVLLFDLSRWRELGVSAAAFDYLKGNPTTPFSDQDALNVACDTQWKEIDKSWNSVDFVHQINLARTPANLRPAIVHFASWSKPWNFSCWNQNAGFYDKIRDRTQFQRSFLERQRDWLRRVWGPSRRTVGQLTLSFRSGLKALL